MKFTTRDLRLITALVAVSLDWLVDRKRMAARDAEWEESFRICFKDNQEKVIANGDFVSLRE
mgnify:CR=1 FL=1